MNIENNAYFTVSGLNLYIKSVIDRDINLNTVFLKGEISNFTNHFRTGHFYMTIKDEHSSIKAVMFKAANQRLRFMPENNMSVILKGRVSVFERDGAVQFYIDDMQPDGAGALAIAFEQLKKRLSKRGWFDESHKKELPAYPEKVGVITSDTGAAVHDIINVISRRYPLCEIVFHPVSVQGDGASKQISDALDLMNSLNCADVIIVGRGGGSMEDLWAFNEENVAQAVYNSHIPVISAVGHETDFTICDFVADKRAPTPSAAAEICVPDVSELLNKVNSFNRFFVNKVQSQICLMNEKVAALEKNINLFNPVLVLKQKKQYLTQIDSVLNNSYLNIIKSEKNKIAVLAATINARNPLDILSKGYSVVLKNGFPVSDVSSLSVGEEIDISFSNGKARAKITDVTV
ncbi:MAG: exodeoxyribonuclease VII large subunit [Clostridiales bacterium]|nr:exodeoxyribonuclease VII large subunit [Clostridiales bacterium]